jgi:hypothetical protein
MTPRGTESSLHLPANQGNVDEPRSPLPLGK